MLKLNFTETNQNFFQPGLSNYLLALSKNRRSTNYCKPAIVMVFLKMNTCTQMLNQNCYTLRSLKRSLDFWIRASIWNRHQGSRVLNLHIIIGCRMKVSDRATSNGRASTSNLPAFLERLRYGQSLRYHGSRTSTSIRWQHSCSLQHKRI